MQSLDAWLFRLMNHGLANPVFDFLMPLLTDRGFLLVIPLLPYLLYQGRLAQRRKDGPHLTTAVAAVVIAMVAVPLADALCAQLKILISRPRPCQALEGVRLLVACPQSFSLPSSHAVTSFAYATPLFLLTRDFLSLGWRLYPLLLAAAVAFSRAYIGVHYPADILAGAFVGASMAGFMTWLYRRSVPPSAGTRACPRG
jgi:undecaprenyl-diphosphatase